MVSTKILKVGEEYAVITSKGFKFGGGEVKVVYRFFGKDVKELPAEPLAEYHNLGPPLGLDKAEKLLFLGREDLLNGLAASGVEPEEIEKLKAKL
ncbi:MAG: hypothetical protein GTN40_04545 [Candidatus Aenigmarchaeota archaeon]|nr:hypothetical protein [Candidatus Aenigmarchaeota archaeon]